MQADIAKARDIVIRTQDGYPEEKRKLINAYLDHYDFWEEGDPPFTEEQREQALFLIRQYPFWF